MSALVAGCFAPDFEYFIPFWHHGAFGHTLPGVFVFDIPAAFIALWAFHHYAKEPLASCLPDGARARLVMGPRSLSINSPSRFVMIVMSILVGVATHILWDSFTHSHSWPYSHWHFLRETVRLPFFGFRQWCDVLQYISSALGLVIILLWYLHWYKNTEPVHPPRDRRSPAGDRVVIACAFAIALIAAFVRAASTGIPNQGHGYQRFMTIAAVTAITVFSIEVLVYGIVHSRRSMNTA